MKFAAIQFSVIRSAPIILLFTLLYAPVFNGQEPKPHEQTAPPPLRMITRLERAQLNEAKDPKARVKLTIELADTHLTNAELQTSQQHYEGAAAELGMYCALIEDVFRFMKTVERDNDRRRDLYKRLELALRAQGPRLGIMRRSTPSEYSVWIKEIEDLARNGRTEALNSFYGHTVLREGQQKSTEAKPKDKPLQED